nr:MAG TPA: hypothetical protein [Caudoviricetes sp.]
MTTSENKATNKKAFKSRFKRLFLIVNSKARLFF